MCPEQIKTRKPVVSCDGGGDSLGHPLVYLNAGDKGADAARRQGAVRSVNPIYIYVNQVVKGISGSVDQRGGKRGDQTGSPGRRRIGRPQADAD